MKLGRKVLAEDKSFSTQVIFIALQLDVITRGEHRWCCPRIELCVACSNIKRLGERRRKGRTNQDEG